jgi:hypothetical protein
VVGNNEGTPDHPTKDKYSLKASTWKYLLGRKMGRLTLMAADKHDISEERKLRPRSN